MRINFGNFISFEKKLVANCAIKNKKQTEPCKIFRLDRKEDRRYFVDLSKNKDWIHFHYIHVADSGFRHDFLPNEFYVLETQDEKCLGYCEVATDEDKSDELFLIETIPSESSKNPTRERKYIGETMLAFLVKRALDKGKKYFFIDCPSASAYSFYKDKCGFRLNKKEDKLALTPALSRRLINKNEKHTNSTIEIIG